MSTEHGDGFFGSEIKKSKRLIIEQIIAEAYADGIASKEMQKFPADYAKKKMVELEKKLGGRPW
jgi:hypothetical protein